MKKSCHGRLREDIFRVIYVSNGQTVDSEHFRRQDLYISVVF